MTTSGPSTTSSRLGHQDIWPILRFLSGLAIVFVAVATAANAFRPELERLGRSFADHTGYFGMALGTLLADGFQFPVPPQFYMLMAIASDTPDSLALISIASGSLLGGASGFWLTRRLRELPWFKRRARRSSTLKRLRGKVGSKSLVALSLTPIAFSWLIYFCGISGYRWRSAAILCALRIPKLLLYYWLVRAGWML